LWVAVSHPGWAQELAFLKGKILADLNAATGAPVVRDIRFTAGPRRGGAAGRYQGEPALGGAPAGTRPAGGGTIGPGWPAAGATEAVSMRAATPAAGGTGAGAPAAAGSGGRASRLEAEPAGLPAGSGGDPELRAALARWQAAARRRRRWALERGWKPCAGCGTLYPPVSPEDAVSGPSGPAAAGRPEPGPRGAGVPTRPLQPEPPGSGGLPSPAGRRAGLVAGSSASAGQGGLCPACRAAAEEQLRQRVRSLLERDPWLSCLQVAAATGRPPAAVARLYREERATLQDQWRARLRFWAARWRRGDPLPPEARSLLLRYALLRTGREPGELDPTTAREAVGSRLQPLWDACFGPPGAVP
ncbi:MAG TPA: DciA family protein, partial [Thermaerobacter sp.]